MSNKVTAASELGTERGKVFALNAAAAAPAEFLPAVKQSDMLEAKEDEEDEQEGPSFEQWEELAAKQVDELTLEDQPVVKPAASPSTGHASKLEIAQGEERGH